MSTLLEQASLVMIPSGYKEDVVYSQIPTSGAGDLSFTRASNGTRINSAGLVEVCPWNLLLNTDTLSSWSLEGGTLTSGFTAPDGSSTALKYVQTTGGIYSGGPSETSGNKTVSVWLKSVSGTSMTCNINDGNFGNVTSVTVTNDWQLFTVTYTTATSRPSLYIYSISNASGIYVWHPQLNIGSTAKPYFPTTDRLNVPRLTYQNGGGGCPSLLLEKQSTNYARSSEDFTNTTYWTGSGSMAVTANQATSPDGTQNADLFYDSGARYNLVTAPVSSYYTFSCYFKRVDVTNVKVTASDFYSGDVEGTFNLVALTSSSTINGDWSNNSTKIESVGNGWYRCTVTALRGSGGSGVAYRVECAESAKSFYAWGYQCEASSYPTSYIPSTSSSATRVADACFKTGISSLIGQTEGVMFVDFNYEAKPDVNGNIVMIIYGASGEAFIYISSGTLLTQLYNGGTVQGNISGSIGAVGRKKIAFAYKQNDFVTYMNGTQIGTSTSGTIPAMSTLRLGEYYATGYSLNSGINQAVIFPTRLTNSELASLTTI